jgi:hypothetical protein
MIIGYVHRAQTNCPTAYINLWLISMHGWVTNLILIKISVDGP